VWGSVVDRVVDRVVDSFVSNWPIEVDVAMERIRGVERRVGRHFDMRHCVIDARPVVEAFNPKFAKVEVGSRLEAVNPHDLGGDGGRKRICGVKNGIVEIGRIEVAEAMM
jgi:hypothetical protein